MSTTVPRTFRMTKELDSKVQQKARELGYINPSEYLRAIVREKVEAQA